MLSITAILAIRNEAAYLPSLLTYLRSQSIRTIVVDNGSTDDSTNICRNAGCKIIDLPFKGVFNLSEHLRVKHKIMEEMQSDWFIHHDADEILHDASGWGGLRSSIEDAEDKGFNCLNFNEIVVLPSTSNGAENHFENNRYYFFQPSANRLMRAFSKRSKLSNIKQAGHRLEGDEIPKIYPNTMFLRHFIARSQEHAYEKYVGRVFSEEDISRRYHGNRRGLTAVDLEFPFNHPWLKRFGSSFDATEVLANPRPLHFWQWPKDTAAL